MKKKYIIIAILEQVLHGDIKADQAIKNWPDIDSEKNSIIKEAWHNLYHYSVDSDIQDKDLAYKEYQIDKIREDVERIRNI